MTKLKSMRNTLKSILTFLPRTYRKLSISTQLLVTFILIFVSFFILQTFLNNTFFRSYYTEREFDKVHSVLMDYVDEMNEDDIDYYDAMYDYTTRNNAYSVVVNGQYRILTSSFTSYTVTIQETGTNELFNYIVPNNVYDYSIGETLTVTLYEYNDDLYTPAVIITETAKVLDSEVICTEETCMSVTGEVVEINKPNNLNYFFDENLLVDLELSKMENNVITLQDHEYATGSVDGYWYRSTDGPVDSYIRNFV